MKWKWNYKKFRWNPPICLWKKGKQTCQTSLGLKSKKANKINYYVSSGWTWNKISCLDSLSFNESYSFMYAALLEAFTFLGLKNIHTLNLNDTNDDTFINCCYVEFVKNLSGWNLLMFIRKGKVKPKDFRHIPILTNFFWFWKAWLSN